MLQVMARGTRDVEQEAQFVKIKVRVRGLGAVDWHTPVDMIVAPGAGAAAAAAAAHMINQDFAP